MDIVARAKAILTTPNTEWPVIEAEPSSVESIYRDYLIYLAAIPAIANFLIRALHGSFFGGLIGAVAAYVATLVLIYVVALLIDALAPSFDGQKNPLNALKLAGYSATAAFIGNIFVILPLIGWIISLAASIYGLYTFYIGLPVLMKNPPEKSVIYTVAICVVYVVVAVVIGLFVGLLAGA